MCRALCSSWKPSSACSIYIYIYVYTVRVCVCVRSTIFWSWAKGQEVIILCFNYSQERVRDTITRRTEKYPRCSQRDGEKKIQVFWITGSCSLRNGLSSIYRYDCSVREWRVLHERQYKTMRPWDEIVFYRLWYFFLYAAETLRAKHCADW